MLPGLDPHTTWLVPCSAHCMGSDLSSTACGAESGSCSVWHMGLDPVCTPPGALVCFWYIHGMQNHIWHVRTYRAGSDTNTACSTQGWFGTLDLACRAGLWTWSRPAQDNSMLLIWSHTTCLAHCTWWVWYPWLQLKDNGDKLAMNKFRMEIKRFVAITRVRIWNSLPVGVVEQET